ncbi:hypothetical protein [Macrococcus armenti]|uniref:hypothetical protein n=1 Tax=Macrococcus armenti TaxID=2875764 RepID=UPI001CC949FE|nr:hypothetical protein [Macrococcus armenti]UBH16372.1 hypothetical protein LAU44_05300 [Macrococcus armenti]UBH18728.1 hypothetical protein LAU39_05310 [Macrococcus armenti]UBH21000.1 hypothetical protein LAU40_05305 [Macrococcus armenti]
MKELRTRNELMEDLRSLIDEIGEFNKAHKAEEEQLTIFATFGEIIDGKMIGHSMMIGTGNAFANLVRTDKNAEIFAHIVAVIKISDSLGGGEDVE